MFLHESRALKHSMQCDIETRLMPDSEYKRFDAGINACGSMASVGTIWCLVSGRKVYFLETTSVFQTRCVLSP